MKIAKYYLIVYKEYQGHFEIHGGFIFKFLAKLYFHSKYKYSVGWILDFNLTKDILKNNSKKSRFYLK